MSLPWELGATPEVTISHETFNAYHSEALGTAPSEIKRRWEALQTLNGEPAHWPSMIVDDQLSITMLREALTKTFQRGVLETAGRHQHYDRPVSYNARGLGRARLLGLISLVNAYDEHEPIPPADHDMQLPHGRHWALTPETGITAINLFEYTDRLRYRRPTFIDKTALRFFRSHMEHRLPNPPLWGEFSYDYDAYERGAVYPTKNGVAFAPPTPEWHYRNPVEEYISRKPGKHKYDEPVFQMRYRGLTPTALAEAAFDTKSVARHHLTLFSYSALLKYVKVLRRADMHDVKPPLPSLEKT